MARARRGAVMLAAAWVAGCGEGQVTNAHTDTPSNADLTSLVLSSAALTPAFSSAVTSYVATVADPGDSVTVTPTAADAGASIEVQGAAVASGVTSAAIPLSAMTTITIDVTGPDGTTHKEYTVLVELRGWQLDGFKTGLAARGIVCFGEALSGCDDAHLPLYTGPSKPAAGTVITGMHIDKVLDLSNGDITIERCRIRPLSVARGMPLLVTYDNGVIGPDGRPTPAAAPVTIRDCDIDGGAISDYDISMSCAVRGNAIVERCHIYGVGTGIAIIEAGEVLETVVQGNYIHGLRAWGDPAQADGSHNDGITIRDLESPAGGTFRNNRIACDSGNDTGAFFIQTYSGDIDQVLVEGNLLEGGGYRLALEVYGSGDHIYGEQMYAIDNRFAPGTNTWWTYVTTHDVVDYGWADWRDNYVSDPDQPDHRGTAVADPSPE